MRRIFTTDAKNGGKADATKSADAGSQSTAPGLPDIEVVYAKGVEEIVAGRLNLDVAVADVSKVYNLNPPDVKAEFEKRVAAAKPDSAPAPTDDVDLAAKKKRAERLVAEAVKAEKVAADAAEVAKKARLKADAAMADAENMVLVSVPSSFHLSIRRENGRVDSFHVKAGSTKLPREQAEHDYAKANGVKILGLPGTEAKAAA